MYSESECWKKLLPSIFIHIRVTGFIVIGLCCILRAFSFMVSLKSEACISFEAGESMELSTPSGYSAVLKLQPVP
jgi:hypothetical protein